MDAIKNEIHEVIRCGLFDCQVCSTGTEDEALDWLRSASPAGTTYNWQKSDAESHRPVACSNGGGKMHYLFVC